MSSLLRSSSLALACLLLFGCAQAPAKRDPRDPLERINRVTYKFNDGFDKAIARPVAKAYVKVAPRVVRTGVSNFVDNLTYPVTIVNDLLQAKFKQTCSDTGRLLLNTTVGLGGLFDPASAAGLDKNDEDLGQTFGKWGVKPGPYLIIPFIGFSDFRDAVGKVGDIYTHPTHYIQDSTVSWSLWGVEVLDTRARLLSADSVLDGVYDPYTFTKNAYLARRQYLVTDGEIDEQPPPEDPGADDATQDSGAQSAAPQDAQSGGPSPAQPPAPSPAQPPQN